MSYIHLIQSGRGKYGTPLIVFGGFNDAWTWRLPSNACGNICRSIILRQSATRRSGAHDNAGMWPKTQTNSTKLVLYLCTCTWHNIHNGTDHWFSWCHFNISTAASLIDRRTNFATTVHHFCNHHEINDFTDSADDLKQSILTYSNKLKRSVQQVTRDYNLAAS